MAQIERLSIALPMPIVDSVRKAVEAGEYASVSEVMRDALHLWDARRELHQRDIELLRQRWDEGKASGIAGPFDIERVIAKGKAPSSDRLTPQIGRALAQTYSRLSTVSYGP